MIGSSLLPLVLALLGSLLLVPPDTIDGGYILDAPLAGRRLMCTHSGSIEVAGEAAIAPDTTVWFEGDEVVARLGRTRHLFGRLGAGGSLHTATPELAAILNAHAAVVRPPSPGEGMHVQKGTGRGYWVTSRRDGGTIHMNASSVGDGSLGWLRRTWVLDDQGRVARVDTASRSDPYGDQILGVRVSSRVVCSRSSGPPPRASRRESRRPAVPVSWDRDLEPLSVMQRDDGGSPRSWEGGVLASTDTVTPAIGAPYDVRTAASALGMRMVCNKVLGRAWCVVGEGGDFMNITRKAPVAVTPMHTVWLEANTTLSVNVTRDGQTARVRQRLAEEGGVSAALGMMRSRMIMEMDDEVETNGECVRHTRHDGRVRAGAGASTYFFKGLHDDEMSHADVDGSEWSSC